MRTLLKVFFIWSKCVLCTTGLFGLDFIKYQEISSDLGLPGTTVRCIERDQLGIMWIGVEGLGLSKYNGHDFITYRNDGVNPDILTGNNVEALLVDSKGRLWVGTMSGANLYHREKDSFEHFTETSENSPGFIGNLVDDIEEDQMGNIWFGSESGLCVYDDKTQTFQEVKYSSAGVKQSLPRIYDLFRDQFGFIWICTKNGLFKLDPSNRTCLKVELLGNWDSKHQPVTIFAVTEDRHGKIWLGTEYSLLVLDEETGRCEVVELFDHNGVNIVDVSCLMTDSRGYIWAGTWSSGLRILDPVSRKMKVRYRDPRVESGLKSEHIRSLLEDDNGLVWIGAKNSGIAIYDPRREIFRHIAGSRFFNEGLLDRHIFALKAHGNDLWVGTVSSGAYRYNTETESYERFHHDPKDPTSLLNDRVEGFYLASDKNIWIANGEGVSLLNPETGNCENFPLRVCRGIERKNDRYFWVATSSGIEVLDSQNGKFEPFPIVDGIDLSGSSNVDIRSLYKDSDGSLWICTNIKGLWIYEEANKRLYQVSGTTQNGISLDTLRTPRVVMEDSKGQVWVGTRLNGLFLWNRETDEWKNYSENVGLPSKTIFGILEDKFGHMWLSTNQGVISFDPETEGHVVYDTAYGLQGLVFENHCYAVTDNGSFFFGGAKGLNRFKPDQVRRNKYSADLVISSVSINGELAVKDALEPFELNVPHDQDSLRISFSLLDYSFPGRNEYEYRLHGIDSDWVQVGSRNLASYPSLKPGNYKFEVRGKNPNEDEFSDSNHFSITISPPFWSTWWFRILVAVVVIVVVLSIFFHFLDLERRQNYQLEKLVSERTQELENANSQLWEKTLELEDKGEEIERQNEELTQHKFYLEELVVERTKELESAKNKAEESDRLKSAFIANMSHEIRTPLNAVMGFSQLLEDELGEEVDIADTLKVINENTDMLVQLLNDIIDFSVLQTGDIVLNELPIEGRAFFDELSLEFSLLAKDRLESGVTFQVVNQLDGKNNPIFVKDPIRLRQILMNLMTNASKFTESGFVEFGTRMSFEGAYQVFWVRDTGIGISPGDQERIFERFYKVVDGAEKFYQGAGLGLSISKNLADKMNCQLRVDSALDHGSCFELGIPVSKHTTLLETTNGSSASGELEESVNHIDLQGYSILVGEDIQNNFEVIKKYLADTRVTLEHAKDGIELLEKFQTMNPSPDLLLVDIKMPKKTGDEALREIRRINKSIPALAQTAHALPVEKERMIEVGFQDCLIKPIGRSELLTAIANQLRPKGN